VVGSKKVTFLLVLKLESLGKRGNLVSSIFRREYLVNCICNVPLL